MASDLKYAWPLIMATLVSGLATSTARGAASAEPRILWIATKRNRALASRSITNRTHQEQSTQTPSNKMSRSGTSSRLCGIHRLLTRSSTDRADDGQPVRGRRSSRHVARTNYVGQSRTISHDALLKC